MIQHSLFSAQFISPEKFKTDQNIYINFQSKTEPRRSFDILYIDVSILTHTLQRNHKQHGKTSYFRRLKMLLRCFYRYRMLPTSIKIDDHSKYYCWENIFYQLSHQRQNIISLLHDTSSVSTNIILLHPLSYLHNLLTKNCPEIISRILQCASALFTQLSRGYFVPLCTILLACLSRIYILVMQLGLESLWEFRKTLGEVYNWTKNMKEREVYIKLIGNRWINMRGKELQRVWNRYEGDPIHIVVGKDEILERFLDSLDEDVSLNLNIFGKKTTDSMDSLSNEENDCKRMIMDVGEVVGRMIRNESCTMVTNDNDLEKISTSTWKSKKKHLAKTMVNNTKFSIKRAGKKSMTILNSTSKYSEKKENNDKIKSKKWNRSKPRDIFDDIFNGL